MIGFREQVICGRSKVPFVLNPIPEGWELMPMEYLRSSVEVRLFNYLKNILNQYPNTYIRQGFMQPFKKADILISAVKSVSDILSNHYQKTVY